MPLAHPAETGLKPVSTTVTISLVQSARLNQPCELCVSDFVVILKLLAFKQGGSGGANPPIPCQEHNLKNRNNKSIYFLFIHFYLLF